MSDGDLAGPVGRDSLRVSDAERQGVVERLNAAFAEGRLEMAELEERVAAAYAAKTVGDLRPLILDLPLERSTELAPARPAGRVERSQGDGTGSAVAAMTGVFLVNVLIWAAVSVGNRELIYFWPVWLLIPLIFTIVGRVASRRR